MPEGSIIRPSAGDIIVWRVDADFKGDLAAVLEQVRGMFPNNQVIVTNDATVDVWSEEDLTALGLQRIKSQPPSR
jgi:hypothetical protein